MTTASLIDFQLYKYWAAPGSGAAFFGAKNLDFAAVNNNNQESELWNFTWDYHSTSQNQSGQRFGKKNGK